MIWIVLVAEPLYVGSCWVMMMMRIQEEALNAMWRAGLLVADAIYSIY